MIDSCAITAPQRQHHIARITISIGSLVLSWEAGEMVYSNYLFPPTRDLHKAVQSGRGGIFSSSSSSSFSRSINDRIDAFGAPRMLGRFWSGKSPRALMDLDRRVIREACVGVRKAVSSERDSEQKKNRSENKMNRYRDEITDTTDARCCIVGGLGLWRREEGRGSLCLLRCASHVASNRSTFYV